jgi:hypothetical protein
LDPKYRQNAKKHTSGTTKQLQTTWFKEPGKTDYWTNENGTGQQVVLLSGCSMMMVMMIKGTKTACIFNKGI